MDVPGRAAAIPSREGVLPRGCCASALVLLLLAVAPGPAFSAPFTSTPTPAGQEPAPSALPASDTSAALTGRVAYTDGRVPVVGARIAFPELGWEGRTDSDGRFRFEGLPAGEHLVRLELPDGRGTERRLRLAPDTITRVDFRIPNEVGMVEEIHVVVAAQRPDPLTGFRRRRMEERGVFIDRAQIEARQPRQVSDLLRRIPGVQVDLGNPAGAGLRMRRFGARCEPLIYLDGVPAPGLRIDFLIPAELAALEVYRGAAELPLQFGRPTERCGAVIIWTREGGRGP